MRFSREQTMNLRLASSYGSFVAQFDFEWYVSLTYATECSAAARRAKFRRYALDLEQAAETLIFWFCVDEIGVFGRFHQHALIGNVQHLSRETWERRWRYGHARILCYDPGRGAAYYVTKHIAHPNCEFMLSDHIEAFQRIGSELHVVSSNRAWDRGDNPLSGNWQRPEAGNAGLTNSQIGNVDDVSPVGIARNCQPSSYGGSFRVTPEVFHNRARSSEHRERAMDMTKAKVALKGKGLAPGNGQDNLVAQARELDQQIRAKLKEVQRPLIDLGRLMTRMRESGLWKYLGRYRGWEDYVNGVMGPRSRSTLHEILAAYSLTQGSDPFSPEDVDRMGVKRAAQLARLNPEDRTPATIRAATTEPVMVVRNKVQAMLNSKLPKDEQKPMLKLLAINLPDVYVQEFEELIEVLSNTVGARDGDKTETTRHKAFNMMLIATRQYWAQELSEALDCMKAEAGVDDSPAASAEEDFPEVEEGHDFSDDEQTHL